MLYEDVLDSQEIQSLRAEYAVEGVDFQPAFKKAIDQATEGVKSPVKGQIIEVVAMLLKEELQRFLNKKAEKEGTTWFGRAWRTMFKVFKKK